MKFSILGAGSWGTTFAKLLVENGHEALLWTRRQELAEQINEAHMNLEYLPSIELPYNLVATSKIKDIEQFSDTLVIAVPVKYLQETLEKIAFKPEIVINLSKGIDGRLNTVGEAINLRWQGVDYLVLSGPCHAPEVAKRLPTSVVIASKNRSLANHFQNILSNEYFRVYTSEDVLGVEICGAVKNVIAIAAGILDGLGRWHNAKASLITRGLHEMARFGLAKGCKSPLTFMGLAGMGDLIVTCTSNYSRNRYVGEMVGKGKTLQEVLSDMKMVAEGVHTVKPLLELAHILKVDMPISQKVYEVLFLSKNPYEAINELMKRPLKIESDFQNIGSNYEASNT